MKTNVAASPSKRHHDPAEPIAHTDDVVIWLGSVKVELNRQDAKNATATRVIVVTGVLGGAPPGSG